jgi:transglutaminase-like putative cysteine protease
LGAPPRAVTVLAVASLVLAGLAGVGHAQAPKISSKGDPSVRDDTIYKKAVKPADHPEESAIYLLDDGVIAVEPDGRYRETFRQVVQVLREESVEGAAEHSFSWEPGHQKLTLNWIRVLSADGKVLAAKPAQTQVSDVPAEMGNPVYSNRRVMRVSLAKVAVGTIVDYSYTREELKPYRPGDWYQSWSVSTGMGVQRSRLIVDAPTAMPLSIIERNLNFARKEEVKGARTVRTWATGDLARIKGEAYMPDSGNAGIMSLAMASKATWKDIGAWYAGLARDRYVVTPDVAAKIAELVKGARSRDDSIKAIHKWVAQDIRYVSLSLGIGGYQPRKVSEIVRTGFGDCKDKATLFVAALGHLGITAYPVLLNADGGVNRALPSKDQFDHAIAAVPGPNGYVFTDLTADLYPYGQLGLSEQGEFALVVKPDGSVDEATMPDVPPTANFSRDLITGTLDTAGTLTLRFETEMGGTQQGGLRKTFFSPFDSTQRSRFVGGVAGALLKGSTGDSLVLFNGKDLGAKPQFSIRLTKRSVLTHSGDTELFTLPITPPEDMANSAAQLEGRGARVFAIDARKVIGRVTGNTALRITLPEGWKVRLPRTVTADSPFGTYSAVYEQVGREFRLTRSLTGKTGVYPKERMGDLIAWMRTVGSDDAKFVVIERGAK